MDSNHKAYDHLASFTRLDNYLAAAQSNYEEVKELPDRDKLTYTNGYYANCSAIFVDIRDSSLLPNHYNRPKLAKLYRAYISETIAIINSHEKTREINIVGDGVWGVVNTPNKADIDELFAHACRINSLMKVFNYKLVKAGYDSGPLRVGIGLDYGRALMIKAGYNGIGISDVVYMGDVVNHAAKLAAKANKDYSPPIFLGNNVAANLSVVNSEFVTQDYFNGCYTSSAIINSMEQWYTDNCK